MNSLQALQREFQSFVLSAQPAILDRVVGSPTIDPARRLGIYYDAYRSRLIEALETDYTALKTFMGEEAFWRMARGFIEATPSVHRNLRWYGQDLPSFLRSAPPYADQAWLHEIALFEWTISLAFDAADLRSMTFEEMAAIDPSLWPELTFRFHPSLQRLALRTNAASLRKSADAQEPLPAPEAYAEPAQWMLWRKDLTVMFRSLSPEEAWALDRACAGENFTQLCEGLCQWVNAEEAAGRVAGMLRAWVDDQLVSARVC